MNLAHSNAEVTSFSERLRHLAEEYPGETAVVFVDKAGGTRQLSWDELDLAVDRMAAVLSSRGISAGAVVGVGLPNSLLHVVASLGTWRVGACVLLLDARLPSRECSAIIDVTHPEIVLGSWSFPSVPSLSGPRLLDELKRAPARPVPDTTPNPGKMTPSGGSTGEPKIIVTPGPWARTPGRVWGDVAPMVGFRPDQTQLVAGGLGHNAPFTWAHLGLFEHHRLVLMEAFQPEVALDCIEEFGVNFVMLVPTMMAKMLESRRLDGRDFSSLEALYHTAAICPPWLKKRWMDLVGAERVFEMFGSTENVGQAIVRGDDWLAHPGTVGRPFQTEVRILSDNGSPVGAGEVGELFMRPTGGTEPTFQYIGTATARTTEDGFISVGDLASMDQDGYLYVADRRADVIQTGGLNVYPAEVEAVLLKHPHVADVVVVGLRDDIWGRRVHAIIQPVDLALPPDPESLAKYCKQDLSSYKVPKSYEFVEELRRSDFGKIRRSLLARERDSSAP